MNTKDLEWKETVYESPYVECTEVAVEAGFQASLEGTGNEDYEIEDGTWDTI